MQKRKKWRNRIRYLLYALLLFSLLSTVFVVFIEEIFEFSPPPVENAAQILADLGELERHPTHASLGKCWTKEEHGLSFLYLEGHPFVRGWASGQLTGQASQSLENALLERVNEILDSKLILWGLRKVGYLIYHDLPDYFPLAIQQEVYGYSRAIRNGHPELGSAYFRSLNYQSAHDTGHRIMEDVLSLQGCSSFAAWGEATKNGHLLIARNFDFEIGDMFDRFKQVQIVVPDDGIPFLSVSWPGMSGVVSGVNKEKIAVMIHAGKSDHARWKGTPVVIIAREILQHAANLEEAIDILQNSQSFISESFLLADGKTGEVIVVEKSPEWTLVRKSEHFSQAITCANHFLREEFQSHKNHQIFVSEGSSPKRLARTRELVKRYRRRIDPQIAAAILRDQKLEGDVEIGRGHLHTINPTICSHSVIVDLTEGILWVSLGPNQAGEYLPVDIDNIWQQTPEQSLVIAEKIIPADPLFSPQQVAELNVWRQGVKKWQRQGSLEPTDIDWLDKNPKHFLTMVARGDICFTQGKTSEAKDWWNKALDNHPYGEWISQIEKRLQR